MTKNEFIPIINLNVKPPFAKTLSITIH